MAYKKPICDCGSELVFNVDIVIENVIYKINKNGSISKTSMRNFSRREGRQLNFGRLECLTCGNQYEVNMDLYGENKGKVFRDDPIK